MDSEFNNQVRYNCSLNDIGKEIELISSSFNFTFMEQEVGILSYTSISIEQSKNLLEISENIFDKKLYILDNSIVNLYKNNYKFNINGTMDDESFPYDKIILTLNLDKDKNSLNATCSSNKSDKNYIFSCNSTAAIKEKIISGFAALENGNLLVNVKEQTGFSSSKFYFFSTKRSSKLSAGVIIGIIIVLLFVIISLILSFYYMKKKKHYKSIEESSMTYMENNF